MLSVVFGRCKAGSVCLSFWSVCLCWCKLGTLRLFPQCLCLGLDSGLFSGGCNVSDIQ